jgi:hypothetical protein
MRQDKSKKPGEDVPPPAPKTFTTPPAIGTDNAWDVASQEVAAVPDEAVQKPRIDLLLVSETALTVCDKVRADAPLYQRFMAQAAAGEFDPQGFQKLQRYAGAAWYARRMQVSVEGGESHASVPEALLAQGEVLYERMHTVVVYYLGKNPAAAPFLANLNNAPGHRRLAVRLLTLADLYRDHHGVISVDTMNYRSTDEQAARDASTAIIKSINDSGASHAELWGDRAARAWTLLSSCYAEVQTVGLFLLRKTPERAKETFPSLVAEARSPAQPRKAAEPVVEPVAEPAAPAAGEKPAEPAAPAPAAPAAPAVAAAPAPAAPKRKRKSR